MKNMAIARILPVLLGVIALVYQGITYTSRDTVIDRRRGSCRCRLRGELAIVAGAVLLVRPADQRRLMRSCHP